MTLHQNGQLRQPSRDAARIQLFGFTCGGALTGATDDPNEGKVSPLADEVTIFRRMIGNPMKPDAVQVVAEAFDCECWVLQEARGSSRFGSETHPRRLT